MGKADVSTTINRSVEDVFAVVSNFEHDSKWSSATIEDKITSAGPSAWAQPHASSASFSGGASRAKQRSPSSSRTDEARCRARPDRSRSEVR